jgi:hypothetical protein
MSMDKKEPAEQPLPYVVGTYYEPGLQTWLERRHEPYDFKFCEEDDWDRIRAFLQTYWDPGHVYVTFPELLKWQQYDEARRSYNFVYAEHRDTGEVAACLAYIFTSHFDPSITIRDLWLGLWRSKPGAPPGLGGELGRFLGHTVRPRSIGCLGLSKNTLSTIPRMGFTVARMQHHYLINPDLDEFRLVGRPDLAPASTDLPTDQSPTLQELDAEQVRDHQLEGYEPEKLVPVKTTTYLYNRFARHPLLKYRFFAVKRGDRTLGIMVTRTVAALGAKATQIVDYLGHDEGWIGLNHALFKLIRESGVEFIDLYSHGIGEGELAASRMVSHQADDPVIIPIYFDPFEKRNKDLDCGFMVLPGTRYRVFKGDSDQDRPNRPVSAAATLATEPANAVSGEE